MLRPLNLIKQIQFFRSLHQEKSTTLWNCTPVLCFCFQYGRMLMTGGMKNILTGPVNFTISRILYLKKNWIIMSFLPNN